ncbi:fimbrial protein, partial [Serratia ureilytica]|nr:fimbrial protein [Serratia ureilytica]
MRYGEHGTTRLHLLDAQLDGNAVGLRTITPAG